MPHKHTRRPNQKDDRDHDLPPTAIAAPLPTNKQAQRVGNLKSKKRKRSSAPDNDVPKALARILNYKKSAARERVSALDDGQRVSKKQKRKHQREEDGDREHENGDGKNTDQQMVQTQTESLKLLPGERLVDFSARVNQSLPIAGLSHKGKKVEGIKERETRLQKKITKRQEAWRKEEAKRLEKEAEVRDAAEQGEGEDEIDYWGSSKNGRKSKRRRRQGDTGVLTDEDPWEQLKAMREKPRGLNDVAQAPPEIKMPPSQKLKDRFSRERGSTRTGGESKSQPVLGKARDSVIEEYRKLVASKRAGRR